ncbi:MAG: hypothetical protein V2J55_14735 [Candidatus Competibacteraceae bacterium]|jgi:hypothetical protein|nr:hypothetical protein [Candidatus Competibacteraceae bacterium]
MSKDIESKQEQRVAESDDEKILNSRRDFLLGLGKWSKAVIGGVVLGSLITPDQTAEARGSWINRRGGGGWANHRGGGGGWYNRGGGGWINGHGGGGSWLNSGGWVNRGGSWANRSGGGGWVNRRGGGGWYNRR